MHRLRGALLATSFVGARHTSLLWLDSLMERRRLTGEGPLAAGVVNTAELNRFRKTPEGVSYEKMGAMVFQGETLVATRLRLLARSFGPKQMLQMRAAVEGSGLGEAAFFYSPADIYREQDVIMLEYTARSLMWAMFSVLGTVLVFTARPGLVLVMAVVVTSCGAHMFGWMMLTSTPLNALSLIPLLLSVGLCIDYCMHMAHAFWEADGTSSERAHEAIQKRAAAVANGGISTGLSAVVLALGKSFVMTVFFRMLTGLVVVGLYHALLLLPVCLSLLPSSALPATTTKLCATVPVDETMLSRDAADPHSVEAARSADHSDSCHVVELKTHVGHGPDSRLSLVVCKASDKKV